VTGLDVVYLLIEHPEAKGKLAEAQKALGRSVLVRGHLAETATSPPPGAASALELKDFTLESK